MANEYGSAVYGSGYYGAGETPGPQPTFDADFTYILNVNWSGDWANEAGLLLDVPTGTRGRQFYVGKGGKSFEYIQPGEFTFVLDNSARRFDPYNISSPLYGSIEPGKAVEFSVRINATEAIVRLFTGHIKDIRPTSGREEVQMIVTDDLQWLAEQDITIPTSYNVKVNEAIEATLNAASYPFAKSIAGSNCPITFFDPQQANALDTIRSLSDAGLGTVFVDRFGRLKYYDLTTTGQDTTILDQSILLKEITVTQPWDTVRNKVTCVANRYGYGPLEEIWRMDEPLGLNAGQTISFKIEFEAGKVLQPVRDEDYEGWGDYTNFVSGVGWTGVNYYFTVTLSNITSTGCTVNVHNNEASFLVLGWLRLRGNKLVNKKISFDATDAASAAKGPRRLRIDSPWLQDRGFAAAYASLLLAHLKDPSKDPVITLDTRPDGLGIDLLDRINLTSATLGIDVTYDVGYIDYRWKTRGGQSFEQTFHLQNVLYSTATITPQPYIPSLPPVPGVTPVGGGTLPPTTPPGGTGRAVDCTQDYPAISGTTGPFSAGSGMLDDSHRTLSLGIGKWFRSIYHPSRTYVEVVAKWEAGSGDVWALDNSFDFVGMVGYNSLSQAVAHGTIDARGRVADGSRYYLFDNTHPYFVRQLVLDLAVAESGPGIDLYSGTVACNNTAGVQVTGLGIGKTYRIYSTGGPGTFRDSSPIWGIQWSWDGSGWTEAGYRTYDDQGGGVGHNEYYIQATQTSIWIRTNHAASDSSGSLGYALSDVSKRVTIRSVNIYNVCDDDGSM